MTPSPAPDHTPVASTSKDAIVHARKAAPPPPKPVNVFSNDGSFLTRFKKVDNSGQDAAEKLKQQQALERKKAADEKFKNRGKRSAATTLNEENSSSKKLKNDEFEPLSSYQKEVARISSRLISRDEGAGMRPVLK